MLLFAPDLTLRTMTDAEKVEHLEDATFRRLYQDIVADIRERQREAKVKACTCMSGRMCPVHGFR